MRVESLNVMSEGTVRQCVEYSKMGERWPCWKCSRKNLWKTGLHNFRTVLWISTTFTYSYHRLGYHKFWARQVPKMLMGAHKTQRMDSALTFFRAIPQRWRWIFQPYSTINRRWNLGFICECWKQRSAKRLDAVCHKADGNCFVGEKTRADGAIRATRDHNNVTSVLRNTKTLRRTMGMLISSVMLLHDTARPHTAARTRAPLEHFNWELFDHTPYSHDLASSYYHLFTYLKNWLESQRFNNNEELMECVQTWLSSQTADFFDIQKLIPRHKCLSSGCDYTEK
jgi:hypothetical protein